MAYKYNRRGRSAVPESYPYNSPQMAPWQQQQWQQQQWQQPWAGQMGTRGAGGEQDQVGPQQDSGMPPPSDITPQEKAVLRGVLDILKECRVAVSTDSMDELMAQRLTAAQAYLSGFMEAKGYEELGGYLATIPPLSTRGLLDDGEYDELIDDLEQLVDPQTRGLLDAALKAGGKAAWNVGKKVAGKVTKQGLKRVAENVGTNLGASAIWDAGKWGFNRARGR